MNGRAIDGARTVVLAVVLATVALAVAPAPAGASFGIRFELRAGHGYTAEFSVGRNRASVALARVNRVASEVAYYEARGGSGLRRGRFDVNFGRFGAIRGRYTGERKIKRCSDGPPEGVVRGRFRFRGENGYAHVSKRRAVAYVNPYACTVGNRVPPRVGSRNQTVLFACRPEDHFLYAAAAARGGSFHLALMRERTKAVDINRVTQLFAPPRTFTFNPDLTSASVSPGNFFSGSATLEAGLLSGDLAVAMAGVSEPVTITPVNAALLRGEDDPPPDCRAAL